MLRGKNKHINLLKEIGVTVSDENIEKKKLIELKYEALFYRYYYFSRLCKLPYEEIVKRLMNEFFIGDARISVLLTCYAGEIKKINNEALGIKELTEKYPNYNWPAPIKQKEKQKSVIFIR